MSRFYYYYFILGLDSGERYCLLCLNTDPLFLTLGLSNTAGTFAAILGTVGAGFFVELVGSFQGFLLLTSFLYFLAAIFYNIYSTGERVNFDENGQYYN